MAITKIWRVKGWLGHVINYTENPEKTDANMWTPEEQQGLQDVMEYAVQSSKTERKLYVTGINCDPEIAREQMLLTKKAWKNESNVAAYHGCQSFKPGEATPEHAHRIGVLLAQEMWGDRFQVLVATHLDKAHLHNHFVINSVSFTDGKMYYSSQKSYYSGIRAISDRLCKENGLSVINTENGRSEHYSEWLSDQEGQNTWRGLIRKDIDKAISESSDIREFIRNLKAQGYAIKSNVKHIAIKPPGKDRYVRLRSLGAGYSEEEIEEKLKKQGQEEKPLPHHSPESTTIRKALPEVLHARYTGRFNRRRHVKLKGIRALYFHYLCLLGKVKKNPKPFGRTAFLLREDLLKLNRYVEQFRLLNRNRIDTLTGLNEYRAKIQAVMDEQTAQRKQFYSLRKTASEQEKPELSAKAAEISSELRELRKEVKRCEQIEIRSKAIHDRIDAIKQERSHDGNTQHKEQGGIERL